MMAPITMVMLATAPALTLAGETEVGGCKDSGVCTDQNGKSWDLGALGGDKQLDRTVKNFS